MDIVLYALTALLYGGLAVAGWRAHRHTAVEPALAGMPAGGRLAGGMSTDMADTMQSGRASKASGMSSMGRVLLGVALLVHGLLLHTTIFFPNNHRVCALFLFVSSAR